MKLNQRQRYALLDFLVKTFPNFFDMQIAYDFDRFCDGEIREWRVISRYGMAGKLWNNCDRIYISGYSRCEVSEEQFKKQSEEIDKINAELAEAIGIYDDDGVMDEYELKYGGDTLITLEQIDPPFAIPGFPPAILTAIMIASVLGIIALTLSKRSK